MEIQVDTGLYGSDCGAYIYNEDVLDFLVKYDNNLEGEMQTLKPDCATIINSQFLVGYRNVYDANGISLRADDLFQLGYDRIPKCFGLMDASAVQAIGVESAQNSPGLALSGRNVLLGMIDTGIDYANALFRREDGTCRVTAIWDQTKEAYDFNLPEANTDWREDGRKRDAWGQTRPIFGYGREYTQEILNLAVQSDDPYGIVPSRDENGHGTFLTSVAAGNAYIQEDEIFTGVAPETEILMVKLKPAKRRLRDFFLIPDDVPCYSEADIILGIKYLINKAYELGRPLVICLGIGSNQGDHNGNLNLELYLDTIVTLPGICVVGSAGNEFGTGGHFSSLSTINLNNQSGMSGSGARTARNEMEVYIENENPGFCLEIWGKAPSLYQIVVYSPTGQKFDRLMPNRDSSGMITYLYEGTVLYAESVIVENNSGDPFVLLRFERPTAGIWRIEVTENYTGFPAGYDAWLPIRQFLQGRTRFLRPDPEVILCAPANARGTITVAGYNHLDNSLYVESSHGYTRKGRIQPDFAAPAVRVSGLLAGGRGITPVFIRRSGTSVAAALTSGAAALFLEWGIVRGNSFGMNTEVIRQIMIRGTSVAADITYPNPSWGWGILDVSRAFEVLRG